MSPKLTYSFAGALVGGAVSVLGNLVSAGIQHRVLADQFTPTSLVWLIVLMFIGLGVGSWLGAPVSVQTQSRSTWESEKRSAVAAQPVSVTRLQLLVSSFKVRGGGIRLRNIFSLGSKIDIDSRDEKESDSREEKEG